MSVPGVYPSRDVDDAEIRRRERAERLQLPYGREMSPRSRRVAQGIAMVLLVIVLVLVVFGWLNVDALGLSDLTPAG